MYSKKKYDTEFDLNFLKTSFEECIEKIEDCWQYKHAWVENHIPSLRLNHDVRVKFYEASWILYKGKIPENHLIERSCSNCKCANPNHLVSKKKQENSTEECDGKAKKQIEDPFRRRLSNEAVVKIREMLEEGISLKKIGDIFRVTSQAIYHIKKGNNHSKSPENRSKFGRKLQKENVIEIKKLLQEGLLQKEIACKFGVSKLSISNIKTGRFWSHVMVNSL